jgi:hypothetical protein
MKIDSVNSGLHTSINLQVNVQILFVAANQKCGAKAMQPQYKLIASGNDRMNKRQM